MPKSKWQKKYEQAMKMIESMVKVKDMKLDRYSDIQTLRDLAYAEKIQLEIVLDELKRIAES